MRTQKMRETMGKQHQVVKFKNIAEKLPELEGKRLEEITKELIISNGNRDRIRKWCGVFANGYA